MTTLVLDCVPVSWMWDGACCEASRAGTEMYGGVAPSQQAVSSGGQLVDRSRIPLLDMRMRRKSDHACSTVQGGTWLRKGYTDVVASVRTHRRDNEV